MSLFGQIAQQGITNAQGLTEVSMENQRGKNGGGKNPRELKLRGKTPKGKSHGGKDEHEGAGASAGDSTKAAPLDGMAAVRAFLAEARLEAYADAFEDLG